MKLLTQTTSPVHPARLLQRELDARELSAVQAATELGVPPATLQAVLEGGSLFPELAAALDTAWGTPAATWLRLQTQYDTHPAQHGGKRPGAGRPPSGKVTAQVRVTGSPEEIEQIKAWIAQQGQRQGAQATASALLAGIQQRAVNAS